MKYFLIFSGFSSRSVTRSRSSIYTSFSSTYMLRHHWISPCLNTIHGRKLQSCYIITSFMNIKPCREISKGLKSVNPWFYPKSTTYSGLNHYLPIWQYLPLCTLNNSLLVGHKKAVRHALVSGSDSGPWSKSPCQF